MNMALFEAVRVLLMFGVSFTVALGLTPFASYLLNKISARKVNIRTAKEAPIFHRFHHKKSGTVTAAGIIIWGTVCGLALVFFLLNHFFGGFAEYFNFVNRAETYLPLAALLSAALLGLFDDLQGARGNGSGSGGLSALQKTALFFAVAVVGALWFYFRLGWDVLFIPFVGTISIGWWYIPLFVFVLLAASLSANETDGLDGLAGGVLFFAFLAMATVAFVMGRYDLAVMNGAILGALLAFLWFNIYPARFFMGDTGSMSLGITLGVMAMLTNTALFLPFFGFVLALESLSVIVQVASKKIRGKKVFLSSPIHHHFQALGWHESRITMRFWIVSAVSTAFGLVIFFLARFA
jgi:phospho-N-acetylmuramoyl-pentapeptide-transferase